MALAYSQSHTAGRLSLKEASRQNASGKAKEQNQLSQAFHDQQEWSHREPHLQANENGQSPHLQSCTKWTGSFGFREEKGQPRGKHTEYSKTILLSPSQNICKNRKDISLGTRYTTAKLRYMWHLYTGHMENHASTVTNLMHSTCHL